MATGPSARYARNSAFVAEFNHGAKKGIGIRARFAGAASRTHHRKTTPDMEPRPRRHLDDFFRSGCFSAPSKRGCFPLRSLDRRSEGRASIACLISGRGIISRCRDENRECQSCREKLACRGKLRCHLLRSTGFCRHFHGRRERGKTRRNSLCV